MKRILKVFDNAQTVASLWMLSPLTAVCLFVQTDNALIARVVGLVLFTAIGVSLSMYRHVKIQQDEWMFSDACVYVGVPAILFLGIAVVVVITRT